MSPDALSHNYPASGPGSVRHHAVTSMSAVGSFSYDANGVKVTEPSVDQSPYDFLLQFAVD